MNISEYRKKLLKEIDESGEGVDKDTASLEELAGDQEKINQLIQLINDDKSSAVEKISAIDSLNAVSIFSPVLGAQMPEMVNALRGQMSSTDTNIRVRAFATLAAMKDEIAQERLLAELEADTKEEEKLVPTSMAISMLGRDEKALPAQLLHKIALDPPNAESLIEAVRHMSADQESFEVLRAIIEKDDNPLEARAMIPEMINNIDAPKFLNIAREMLQSKGTDNELAPFLTKGIAGVKESTAVYEVNETKALIRNLMGTSSESFKNLANELLFKEDELKEQ